MNIQNKISKQPISSCLSNICQMAAKKFGVKAIDNISNISTYIRVPASVSDNELIYHPTSTNEVTILNPLIFLTGITGKGEIEYRRQTIISPPAMTIVVGHYGVGKTELAHQVYNYTQANKSHQFILPINLALFRQGEEKFTKWLNSDKFPVYLLRSIFDKDLETSKIFPEQLMECIRLGQILLYLDGLDELITSAQDHREYFRSLGKFLSSSTSEKHKFHVVVSMRMEYLSSVDSMDGSQLIDSFYSGYGTKGANIHFLMLDFFNNDLLHEYLIRRNLGDADKIVQQIFENQRLLEMLKRPLLLRIFCDLLEKIDEPSLLFKIERHSDLIESIVSSAAKDPLLITAQGIMTSFIWDIEKLASCTLKIYREYRNIFNVTDVKQMLSPLSPEYGGIDSIVEASDQWIFDCVHKCPFLERIDQNHIRFSHKIFLEYFTAKGISSEVINKDKDSQFNAFDDIVLNPDMRLMLREILGPKYWMERTRKSYGLDSHDEWEFPKNAPSRHAFLDDLNNKRQILLDSMTTPSNPPLETEDTIEWYLSECNSSWLHPRFLTYNSEAVAVYLWYHRWSPKFDLLNKTFMKHLKLTVERVIKKIELLQSTPEIHQPIQAYEILLERYLDIGKRLRHSWFTTFSQGKDSTKCLELIQTQDTRKRIMAILDII
ncbi:NACHT domain-containing protein [Methylomonas sp. HW2-6]|uniref:NACHT domain-containing protein n=1 Tax=Methylomonas sp. HW2-6 TaxID=3376687 RepID=UPI0040433DE3